MKPRDKIRSAMGRGGGRHARQRLSAAAWGELDEHSRQELQAHLEECAPCAAEYEFERKLNAALTSPAAAPPALYFEGVLAEIHRRMPQRAMEARTPRRRAGEVRARMGSMAMGLLVLLWLGGAGRQMVAGGVATAAGRQPSLARGAAIPPLPRLVALESVGLVPRDAEILKLSKAQWEALGLPELTPHDVARLAALRRENERLEHEEA